MADKTEEITKPITDTIKDRLNSPFFGSIVTSWMVINWRVLVILAFGDPKTDRKTAIENYLFEDWCSIIHYVVLPVVSGVVYALAAPKIKKWYEEYVHKHEVALANEKKKLDENLDLTAAQVKELKDKHKNEINALEAIVKTMDEKFTSYKFSNPELSEIADQHKEVAIRMLELLSQGEKEINSILQHLEPDEKINKNVVALIISQLYKNKFVENVQGEKYRISQAGNTKVYKVRYLSDSY